MTAARDLLLCLVLLTGCAVYGHGLGPGPVGVVGLDPSVGEGAAASLAPPTGPVRFGGGTLEKALLTESRPEPAGRGLYVYLLAMPGAQPDRMAALAGAFSCHFEGRRRGRAERLGSERAMFLWPVREADGLRPDAPPDDLRRAYDHDEARALLWAAQGGRSHRRVGGIYVVASNARLATVPEGMVAPAEISDLSDYPAQEIESALLQLQLEIVEGGALTVPAYEQTMLGILGSIGILVRRFFPDGRAEAASICGR